MTSSTCRIGKCMSLSAAMRIMSRSFGPQSHLARLHGGPPVPLDRAVREDIATLAAGPSFVLDHGVQQPLESLVVRLPAEVPHVEPTGPGVQISSFLSMLRTVSSARFPLSCRVRVAAQSARQN